MNQIILGDCLKVMNSWKDGCVDGIVTSPPFRDADIEGDYYDWYTRLVRESQRVSKDYALIFNSSTRTREITQRTDWIRQLIWHKPGGRMAYRFEPIFVYKGVNPSYNFNAVCWCDSISAHSVLRFRKTEDMVYDILRKRSDFNAQKGDKSSIIEGRHPYENPLKLYIQLSKILAKRRV